MIQKRLLISLLIAFVLGDAAVGPAGAQTETILHNFQSGTAANDGTNPVGLTQGSDGNFYGVTNAGGGAGALEEGTVFKMTPAGVITVLHVFSSDDNSTNTNVDGADPVSGLVQGPDGNFYGTAEVGGSTGSGVVYKITPSGTFTTLHDFGDGTVANDGLFPQSALALGRDGNFYGTANLGGTAAEGTLFKITPAGVVTILHNFADGSVPNDGDFPQTALVQGSDGNFYGTTEQGGSADLGTAFKMTPAGVVTILHHFDDGTVPNDGINPKAAFVQGNDGNFYSTTEFGGADFEGAVFKMSPAGVVTIVRSFEDGTVPTDGYEPQATLLLGSDGNFYGTTPYSTASNTNGIVFKMTPSGTFTVFHVFGDGTVANDGQEPSTTLVQGSGGGVYGTTYFGGTGGGGTVFGVNVTIGPPGPVLTSLNPVSKPVGSPAFTLTATGTNFLSGAAVAWNGVALPTTFISATQLTASVPATDLTAAGTAQVTVVNPDPAISNALTFTVTVAWNVQDVAAVSDGTARLLWDRTDGVAGIWSMSANNTQTAVGPTYGPYQGWVAQDITAAGDGTSRILWNRYDGATGVWAMDAHGNQISVSPTYGPFSGWKAIDLATAPNGTSRLMWRYTNGEAGILTLNATGGEIIVGRNYGPYTGWTATAVGAAGDGTARILWTRSDGAMGLWTMDSGDLQKAVGPTYGPYSDSHGTWKAADLSTSADGTSTVLWKRSDGAIGVWTFSASNTQTTVGAVYGPYAGFTAAALDAANDKARVLWVRSDRAAGLWSFGTNDLESLIGPVYGPY